MTVIVYLFPVFMNANILFRPFMELRNNLEEIDLSLVYFYMSLLKKWKNSSKSFDKLFYEKYFRLTLFKKFTT